MKSNPETYPDTFPEMKDVVLLSDQDLLKSLLRKSVKLPNNSLAMAFGMVGSVDEVQDVMDGPSRYMLLCARELMSRALYEQAIARPLLDSPSAAREFLRLKLAGMAYETFWVLYLDAQNRVLAAEEMFRGTLTQTSVYPREIARQALRRNAASLVLAHNHPSGDSRPSKSDEHLTQNIKASMALLDVRVLDHFVVTDTQCVSMAEMGLV